MKSDYLSPQLWKILYSRMVYENALAIRVSLETGLRIGDVLALRRSNIDGRIISFVAKKTGKAGKAVITSDLARRLSNISQNEIIFPGRDPTKPRTRQAVYKDLKRVANDLGIRENACPHSARKTFAAELYHSDGLAACKKALQHDGDIVTLLYAMSDQISNQSTNIRELQNDDLINKIADRVVDRLLRDKTS